VSNGLLEGAGRHKRSLHYEIRKRTEMEFIYAAFFHTTEGRVLIKFGRSCVPAKRISHIALAAPYHLQKACFCQAGTKTLSTAIELSLRFQLSRFRTRGEWFEFERNEGSLFAGTVKDVIARITARQLKWTMFDVEAMRQTNLEALKRYHYTRYVRTAYAMAKAKCGVDESGKIP